MGQSPTEPKYEAQIIEMAQYFREISTVSTKWVQIVSNRFHIKALRTCEKALLKLKGWPEMVVRSNIPIIVLTVVKTSAKKIILLLAIKLLTCLEKFS